MNEFSHNPCSNKPTLRNNGIESWMFNKHFFFVFEKSMFKHAEKLINVCWFRLQLDAMTNYKGKVKAFTKALKLIEFNRLPRKFASQTMHEHWMPATEDRASIEQCLVWQNVDYTNPRDNYRLLLELRHFTFTLIFSLKAHINPAN